MNIDPETEWNVEALNREGQERLDSLIERGIRIQDKGPLALFLVDRLFQVENLLRKWLLGWKWLRRETSNAAQAIRSSWLRVRQVARTDMKDDVCGSRLYPLQVQLKAHRVEDLFTRAKRRFALQIGILALVGKASSWLPEALLGPDWMIALPPETAVAIGAVLVISQAAAMLWLARIVYVTLRATLVDLVPVCFALLRRQTF